MAVTCPRSAFHGAMLFRSPRAVDTDPRSLRCPSCGAQMEIGHVGETRDKIAVCRHCKTVVDLPDTRGTTHERVTERPGERVVERVTEWQSDLGPNTDEILKALGARSGEMKVEGSEAFASEEEFRQHLQKTLSPESAAVVLKRLVEGKEKWLEEGKAGSPAKGVMVVRQEVVQTDATHVDLLPRFQIVMDDSPSGGRLRKVVLDDAEFESLEALRGHLQARYSADVARGIVGAVRDAMRQARREAPVTHSSGGEEGGFLAALRKIFTR